MVCVCVCVCVICLCRVRGVFDAVIRPEAHLEGGLCWGPHFLWHTSEWHLFEIFPGYLVRESTTHRRRG